MVGSFQLVVVVVIINILTDFFFNFYILLIKCIIKKFNKKEMVLIWPRITNSFKIVFSWPSA